MSENTIYRTVGPEGLRKSLAIIIESNKVPMIWGSPGL